MLPGRGPRRVGFLFFGEWPFPMQPRIVAADNRCEALSNPTGEATLGAIAKSIVTIKDDECIGTPITATEGVAFTGVVATFAPSNPCVGAGDYTALINWGFGTIDAPVLAQRSFRALLFSAPKFRRSQVSEQGVRPKVAGLAHPSA